MRPKQKDASNGPKASAGPTETTDMQARLRALPSVDQLCRSLSAHSEQAVDATGEPRTIADGHVIQAARAALDQARAEIREGGQSPSTAQLSQRVLRLLDEGSRPLLRPVLNATGVIVNTNLGRAPLCAAALRAVAQIAAGYANLEFDLDAGERGSRQTAVRSLLRDVTGAEDALVVNNNASSVLLALTSLAAGREVILSRGELVEIGGGFRVPDVMRQSGARLVEVGTTNRTRAADYAAAITPETAALLAVHPSNFRIVGFTEAPTLSELATLAHAHGLPLIYDLGSGALLPTERYGVAHEPMPQESIAAGVDLVCFSGDKLLGGPQAGVLVGTKAIIGALQRHPLARALRIDKLSLAALEATLRQYRDGDTQSIPVWNMIAQTPEQLRVRAERWAQRLRLAGIAAEVVAGESTIGGGSLPGETLPTWLCAVVQEGGLRQDVSEDVSEDVSGERNGPDGRAGVRDVGVLAARLRRSQPPVIGRVLRKRLLLDPRTVPLDADDVLVNAVLEVAKHLADAR